MLTRSCERKGRKIVFTTIKHRMLATVENWDRQTSHSCNTHAINYIIFQAILFIFWLDRSDNLCAYRQLLRAPQHYNHRMHNRKAQKQKQTLHSSAFFSPLLAFKCDICRYIYFSRTYLCISIIHSIMLHSRDTVESDPFVNCALRHA